VAYEKGQIPVSSYRNVVVGTDGSESSYLAVDRAAVLAHDAGAVLHLVSAFRPVPQRDRQRAAEELGDLAYRVEGSGPAEDALAGAEDRARAAGAIMIEKHALQGEPVEVLIEAAKDADVLVVGNRGLNSLSGRLLGSVPQNVSHKAGCDVLIVHTTG
jgi:nucleotide-binding universal stress UspA family protein